jgi:hypothetical protein
LRHLSAFVLADVGGYTMTQPNTATLRAVRFSPDDTLRYHIINPETGEHCGSVVVTHVNFAPAVEKFLNASTPVIDRALASAALAASTTPERNPGDPLRPGCQHAKGRARRYFDEEVAMESKESELQI